MGAPLIEEMKLNLSDRLIRGRWLQGRYLRRFGVRLLVVYLPITALALVYMAPLIWLVSSSLKPEGQVFEYPPNFIPRSFEWSNYPDALVQFPFIVSGLNTLTIVVGVLMGRLLTASLAAYGFARLRFPGRNVLFVLVLTTLMIPYHVILIPQYLIFRDLGWLNTLKPLIVPAWFGGGAFFIFLLRQFFMTIPREYDDAARIDGCGFIQVWWHIIMPMSLPALGAVAIFTFMGEWNDFLAPLIYLNTPEKQTLAIAVEQWRRSSVHTGYNHQWNHIMAVATVVTVPPLLIFFFAQRHFIQGVVISGIKG
jgi:ABC-type glycerol-3-phosphate transport system permease component